MLLSDGLWGRFGKARSKCSLVMVMTSSIAHEEVEARPFRS